MRGSFWRNSGNFYENFNLSNGENTDKQKWKMTMAIILHVVEAQKVLVWGINEIENCM